MTLPTPPSVLLLLALAAPAPAFAQTNVGAGPMTGTLAETEPTSGVLGLGPFKLAPGIVVRELGWDSNVFDEATDPKEDYVAAILPDLAIFSRTRFVKLSGYGGGEFVYYRTYESERSRGYSMRGRIDLLLSRMRPFVAGGESVSRTRPNGEIDTRADLKGSEVSGGFAFELGAHSTAYVAAYETATRFRDAFEEGVELGQSLNRNVREYSGGVKTDLTPLLALTVSGSHSEERFQSSPLRDTKSWLGTAGIKIGVEAVVSGVASISYRDFKPVDPLVRRYRGIIGTIGMAYPFMEVGRFSLVGNRSIEHSFDESEGYFIENTVSLSYTHRLVGAIDAQVRGSKSFFDYGFREGSPARQDQLDVVSGGLGYNLRNRTRVSVNYEYSRRRSPAFPDRTYDRRRIYSSWTYGF